MLGRFGVMRVRCDQSFVFSSVGFFSLCVLVWFLFEVQHETFRHMQLDLQFSLSEIKTVYTPNQVLACSFFA